MKIIYEEGAGVCILIPVINNEIGLTIEQVALKDVPKGREFEIIEDDAIPSDRTFRAAWKKGQGKVEVDMPKARGIHMDRIRVARNQELKKTDIEVARQVEAGSVSKELKDRRNALREIPQTFDLESAQTPDKLKVKWPPQLQR